MSSAEQRIEEIGLVLPKKTLDGKALLAIRRNENLLYTSGHGSEVEDGIRFGWEGSAAI